MNTKFAKLEDGRITFSPDTLVIGGRYIVSPTDADYLALEWKPVIDEKPSEPAPAGFHYAAKGWKDEGGRIVRVYELVEDPAPPPRVFSKLKLYGALVSAGLWDSLESWLKSQTVAGVNAFTAFSLAQDLSEDYPGWNSYVAAIKSALGLTDEQVEAVLSASVVVE